MTQLTPEVKLILASVKIHPSHEELECLDSLILEVTDWDYLVSTIIDLGLGPLLYKKITLLKNSKQIPHAVHYKLQQTYYRTFSRSVFMYEHFHAMAGVLTSRGIDIIALKGIYLSEWMYEDPGLRQFADIDILVKKEDALTCLGILLEYGYISTETEKIEKVRDKFDLVHFAPMVLDGVSIEVHINLHRKSGKYKLNIDQIIKNALPFVLKETTIYAPNLYDLLVHLCVHLDKHFRVEFFQFTGIIDITNILEIKKDNIDWNHLIDTSRLHKCENIVFMYVILINKYLNAYVPQDIIDHYCGLLSEKDEMLFCKYVGGFKSPAGGVPNHLWNLRQHESFFAKFSYLLKIIFPSRIFMITKYQIRHPFLVFFYYPYRYFSAIKGLISILKSHSMNDFK